MKVIMARRLIIQTPLVASADAACIVTPIGTSDAAARQYRPLPVETATTYRKWKKIIAGGVLAADERAEQP
ncbi:hypothetical protein [Bradyrhizobium sp. HKCCYLRH1030]|uniref:hypothetical protein n=1 Tax=Bradyrhizobium sp. HKCCYLRH1030 TaxID=3420744 RepID=UPI003EBB3FE3